MKSYCTWEGLDFSIYDPDAVNWSTEAGVYIFAFVNENELWEAVYIGQAANFKARLCGHERWEEAELLGATHVHARVVRHQANRDLVESRLISTYQPPLNDHLK